MKSMVFVVCVVCLTGLSAIAGAYTTDLNIKIDYQVPNLNSNEKEILQRSWNVVKEYLQSVVKVKRASEVLQLPQRCRSYMQWSYSGSSQKECVQREIPERCGLAINNKSYYGAAEVCSRDRPGNCYMNEGGPGVKGAQLIIYVTAVDREGCTSGQAGELALAQPCVNSDVDGRTLAGNINVCPGMFKAMTSEGNSNGFDHLAETLLHETLHLLAFSPDLFVRFVDDDGNTLPEDQVIKRSDQGLGIITPMVLSYARRHFGCKDMDAVPLENQGGEGTAESHWSIGLFGSREIMIPIISSGNSVVSNMTLALLQDSGWFEVNYGMPIGHMGFGSKMGCAAVRNCNAGDSRFYCSANDGRRSECTWDHYAGGQCQTQSLSNGCQVVKPFGNTICRNPSGPGNSLGFNATLWGQSYGASARCMPVAPQPQRWQIYDNARIYTLDLGAGTGCYTMSCTNGNVLKVGFSNGKQLECREGEYINAKDIDPRFSSGRLGPCPAPSSVCPFLGCKDDCNSKGDCYKGKCSCYLGYEGAGCEGAFGKNVEQYAEGEVPKAANQRSENASAMLSDNSIQEENPPAKSLDDDDKLSIKAIVIGSAVFLVLIAGALIVMCLIIPSRRRRAQERRGSTSVKARGRNKQKTREEIQCTPFVPQNHNAFNPIDLDGGKNSLDNIKALYGNDIVI